MPQSSSTPSRQPEKHRPPSEEKDMDTSEQRAGLDAKLALDDEQ